MTRKERFGGGLDQELALFDEMKARIQTLEEQLNSAPRFAIEEKTALNNALAEEKVDKAKYLEDAWAAQADLT